MPGTVPIALYILYNVILTMALCSGIITLLSDFIVEAMRLQRD